MKLAILGFFYDSVLLEINFGESRRFKNVVFAILWFLNFVNLVNLSPQKVQNFIKIQISDPQFVKMADF